MPGSAGIPGLATLRPALRLSEEQSARQVFPDYFAASAAWQRDMTGCTWRATCVQLDGATNNTSCLAIERMPTARARVPADAQQGHWSLDEHRLEVTMTAVREVTRRVAIAAVF